MEQSVVYVILTLGSWWDTSVAALNPLVLDAHALDSTERRELDHRDGHDRQLTEQSFLLEGIEYP